MINNKVLLIIIFSIILLYFNNSLNIPEKFILLPTKKKYAVCMYGQLRGISSTIDLFYKNLIDILDADLYLICQKTNVSLDNNINLFNKNIIYKLLYDPPQDIKTKFLNYDRLFNNDNYIDNACLQVYYNLYKISELIGDILEQNYDYIILTRSDFLYLFPFPDILKLCNNELIWYYDGHEHGGINGTLLCIPSKFIKIYLTSPYNYLQDPNNINTLNEIQSCNAETYLKLLFDINNFKIGKMQMNSFISADSTNDITTWNSIKYSEEYKVCFKYEEQLYNAFNALDDYKNGKRWKYIDTEFIPLIKLEY
jgi:hypothetical protein